MQIRGPAPKLSDGRKSGVNARLEDGYTVEQIKEAILGCLSNDFNVRGGYTDLELITKPNKIEQYRSWHHGGRPETEQEKRKQSWQETPPEPKEWE